MLLSFFSFFSLLPEVAVLGKPEETVKAFDEITFTVEEEEEEEGGGGGRGGEGENKQIKDSPAKVFLR